MATISDTILTNLRLAGQRAYTAGMNAAALSAERLSAANAMVDESAKKMGGQLNQSIFNMGNLLHVAGRATMAMGVLATAGAYVGIKFNASMEQSQVAFGELLGSVSDANTMLQNLFDLAARTPFEFPQITDAAQKLLGFGMEADSIIPLLSKVGDAVAAVGADPERIDRITRALGQMQAKGKVYSEELLQLADAGLPAYQMLMKGLGVSGTKLNSMLRKGQINAKQGLDILSKQMDKRYRGMAEKQSKTFNGLLSTIRDYSRMILGFAIRPLFDYLEKKVLPVIAKVETGIVKWGRSGGFDRFKRNASEAFKVATGRKKKGLFTPDKQLSLAQKVGGTVGKVWKALSSGFADFMDALAPAKPFWDNVLGPFLKGLVVGALGGFLSILKIAIPVIKLFATALGWLGKILEPVRDMFYWLGFAIGFIFGPGKIFGFITKALGNVGRAIGFVVRPLKWMFALFERLGSLFGKLIGRITGLSGSLINKLVPSGSKVEDIVLRLLEIWALLPIKILKALPQIAGALYSLGAEMMGKLWAGIKSKGSGPVKFVMKLFGIDPDRSSKKPLAGVVSPVPPGGGAMKSKDKSGGPKYSRNYLGNFQIDNYTILDGKIVAKSVAKNTQDKMARR